MKERKEEGKTYSLFVLYFVCVLCIVYILYLTTGENKKCSTQLNTLRSAVSVRVLRGSGFCVRTS